MKNIFLILLALLVVPTLAHAKVAEYEFDKAHTQILFFVSHLGFSMSQGEFHDYDGVIQFDEENPEAGSIEITIKTDSIDMDDQKWDKHMKNEDFFDVKNYPTMTFKSTSIEKTGEKTANIAGDLTILDVTKPVVLQTTFNKAGVHPFTKRYVAGFSATTAIKRSEFGMI
ncbi:MAG: YceI family protein [Pseudomonadota bacterium]